MKLVLSQHGGGYGIARRLSLDKHFVECFDKYYTWVHLFQATKGFPDAFHETKKFKNQIRYSNPSGDIMWIATTVSRYKTFVEDGLAGPHMMHYFDQQKKFFNTLTEGAKDLLLWRYFNDPWEDVDRVKDFAPNLKVQHGSKKQLGKKSDFIKELNKCRLAIHTANETTYLEALSSNFPSLLFWDPEFYNVRAELAPVFDALVDAGILHYTPESAAQKLNEVYENPLK